MVKLPDPTIYDAVTAYATALTALPAMVAAFFGWLQVRQYVLVETTQAIHSAIHGPARLEMTITLRNKRRASIGTWALEIVGLPVKSVEAHGAKTKGPNWTANSAPFPDKVVPPGEAREYQFTIMPDWTAALAAADRDGLKWTAVVSFNDLTRDRKRWFRRVKTGFELSKLERYAIWQ